MLEKVKEKKILFLYIALIFLIGAFFRVYNFSDWLHFELDQARDIGIAKRAVEEGAGNLPLQGPRAAGSFLRLGPAFYYFQYISALIFGPTPQGVAYIVVFFSILSMPLFYVFCRRYFDRNISIGLTSVFSVSIFMVMYSRFAWNPNLIPFFLLLSFYSILKVVDAGEKRKTFWLAVFALSFSVATQLHFLVFLSLPLVVFTFLIIKKPKISWKGWVLAVAIVLLSYSPVIINDFKTGGENSQEFFKALTQKSEKDEFNLVEKTLKNYTNHSLYYFLIVSGQQKQELPSIDMRNGLISIPDIRCDYSCREGLFLGFFSAVFFTLGVALLLLKTFSVKEAVKKDFLQLSSLWFVTSFVLMIPIAFNIAPRFFLLGAPITFIFLGLMLEYRRFFHKQKTRLLIIIILALSIMNIAALLERFDGMKNAYLVNMNRSYDKILKEKTRVTLEQQKMIVEYMVDIQKQNGMPIFYMSESEYRPAFKYLLSREVKYFDELPYRILYENGNYFFVSFSEYSKGYNIGKYSEKYDIIDEKKFGTLTVLILNPRKGVEMISEKDFNEPEEEKRSSAPKRYIWKEIFSGSGVENDKIDGNSGDFDELEQE